MTENEVKEILLQDAVDCLEAALHEYEYHEITQQDKQLKFAVLHFSRFFELIIKWYIAEYESIYLLFDKPAAPNFKFETAYTKGANELIELAINIVKIDRKLFQDVIEHIKSLRNTRNSLEHFVLPDTKGLKSKFENMVLHSCKMIIELKLNDMIEGKIVNKTIFPSFMKLAYEYEDRLARALKDTEKYPSIAYCSNCMNWTSCEDEDGFFCTFCEDSEPAELCSWGDACEGGPFPASEMVDWHDNGEKICEQCYEQNIGDKLSRDD